MEIKPGVYSYDLEWHLDDPLTVQVIETDEATVMFGGGKEVTAEQQIEIAEDHGGLDVVVVEHGDGDHFEAIPKMQEELDFEIAVPMGDIDVLEGRKAWDRSGAGKSAVITDEDTGLRADKLMRGGETYWGGVETILAPGHTCDNMAFLYEDVLLAGDTLVGLYDRAGDIDWSGELANLPPEQHVDAQAARNSIRNLRNYDFNYVLTTHGANVLEDAKHNLNLLIDDIEKETE
jgi:glyoxylase-like metal-dependent hydrolase (beta-lactamase superfamily II)